MLDFILDFLGLYGAGRGVPEADLVRFSLAAFFWAVLLGVSLSRKRANESSRERWLAWGFGLGLSRELLMLIVAVLTLAGLVDGDTLHVLFPPAEHFLTQASVVVVAAAFIRYLLKNDTLARRYLNVGLGATAFCYLATFWGWAQTIRADPSLKFGMTWYDWLFRITASILIGSAMVILARHEGWLRNVVLLALSFFFLDEFLMLFNLASQEVYASIYGPIRHNLHIWTIPILGYVYFKEMAIERDTMVGELRQYRRHLEELVQERTRELEAANGSLKEEIEERRRTEASLARAKEAAEVANTAKSSFLANMSHELRSPLNAIIGFAQLMARSEQIGPEHLEHVGIISRSGEHLLTLINDVLELSKIEAGQATLNLSSFDLKRLLNDVEDMFELAAEKKGLVLRLEMSDDVPRYICTDEGKLRQVLINLVSNALKFTDNGHVTIRAQGGDMREDTLASLAFEVEDTGHGIEAAELETLFNAFVQTETGRERQEGTGLGLPISRHFVQLMEGGLTVTSEVGRGSTFRFNMVAEIAAERTVKEALAPQRVVGLASPGSPRVLVVDDKRTNRELLRQLLGTVGFQIREAANGQEAVDMWSDWLPDLIIMDMRMPVMGGKEASRRIKASAQGAATRIIALTASSLEEERREILAAGCDEFMRKPFREAELFTTIARLIDVKFIYDKMTADTSAGLANVRQIGEAMAALPTEMLAALEAAARRLDMEAIEWLVGEIQPHDSALAHRLRSWADDYNYDAITDAIESLKPSVV